jgi:hypothetical protein
VSKLLARKHGKPRSTTWASNLETLILNNLELIEESTKTLLQLPVELRLKNVAFLEKSSDYLLQQRKNKPGPGSVKISGLLIIADETFV